MAKRLSKKQNKKNWNKGLKTKAITIENNSNLRKGIILN